MFGLGAITGVVMTIAEKGIKIWDEKKQREHELALFDAQAKFKADEAVAEARVAEANMQTASYQMKMTSDDVPQWVNTVKTLFRPTMTLVALILFALDEFHFKTGSVVLAYLAETSFVWWFGNRAINRK